MQQIAVIGASPAGLLAAGRLARSGMEVTVYDRATTLAPVPRSLIVTHHLRDLVGDHARNCVVNEIDRFELYADGLATSFRLQRPDLIIERARLISSLADEARSHGARLRLGRRLARLDWKDGAVRAHMASGNGDMEVCESSTLIGADGARSKVARAAGWPVQPTVPLLQARVGLPSDLSPDTTRVWFRPEDTRYFYWLIPESERHGVLGVIGEDASLIRERLDAFLAEKNLEPLSYQAAMIPAYRRWIPVHRKLGDGDVYLAGDAAGQVKVSTVGGIVTGLRGASAIADLILDGSKSSLRALRRELDVHLLIRRAIHRFEEEDYRSVIRAIEHRRPASLSDVSRDEGARSLLAFARVHPGVILRALRLLLVGR